MNRISSIRMSATSPMGEMRIATGLYETDIILVQGRNGSGKTSIAEELCKPGAGVECWDVNGEIAEIPAGRLSPTLVIRRGSELMAEFKSLDEALAKASGVERVRELGMLLDKLLSSRGNATWALDRLKPADSIETPPEVARLKRDMLEAESRLWKDHAELAAGMPLTLGTYARLAKELAKRLGREAPGLGAAVDEEAMREVESVLSPDIRWEPGDEELHGFLGQVGQHPLTKSFLGLPEQYKRLRAEPESVAAVEHVRQLNALDEGFGLVRLADHRSPWEEAIEDEIERLDSQRTQITEEIEGIDALGALRAKARDWLEASPEPPQECPVCRHDIDRDEVIRGLANSPVVSDTRREELNSSLEKLNRRLEDLGNVKKQVARLSKDWSEILTVASEWREWLATSRGALRPAEHWESGVAAIAENFRVDCEELMESPGPSETGCAIAEFDSWLDNAQLLVSRMSDRLKDHQDGRESRRKGLEPARAYHDLMRALRELLVSREGLNGLVWNTTWADAESARKAIRTIEEWKLAAKELRKEFEGEEHRMREHVLQSEETRQRFARLIERVDHPLIRNQGVDADWESLSQKLSEGYRVLVNLAAFIAVAGYVCPGQDHAAGWIVLDEPTNGLDPGHQILVARYLGGLGTELMSRQMFVMSFEGEFGKELTKSARDSGCRFAEIRLSDWSDVPVSPSVVRH